MWARKLKKGLDFAETSHVHRNRRGMRLMVLLAIMAVIPGLVAGTSYISGASSPVAKTTIANVQGPQCGWYAVNSTDMGNQTSKWGTGSSDVLVTGLGSTTVSVQANVTKNVQYEYLVNELAFVCVIPAVYNTMTVGAVTPSAITADTSDSGIWAVNTFEGGAAAGYSGEIISGTQAWVPAAAAHGNDPDQAGINPTAGTACDTKDGTGPSQALYVPHNNTVASKVANTWTYSLNQTGGGWTADHCTYNSVAAAPPAITVTATAGTTVAFYTLSLAFVNVPSGGLATSVAATFTISVTST